MVFGSGLLPDDEVACSLDLLLRFQIALHNNVTSQLQFLLCQLLLQVLNSHHLHVKHLVELPYVLFLLHLVLLEIISHVIHLILQF